MIKSEMVESGTSSHPLRLGVNIDHIATLRNARGGQDPDPVRAAHIAAKSGADSITVHLREDRRHIRDRDIERLKDELTLPLNMEMACTVEMVEIAKVILPFAVCLVPEKREELTTEGGLDLATHGDRLFPMVEELKSSGIKVTGFIDPNIDQIETAKEMELDSVELHTGVYCDGGEIVKKQELVKIKKSALLATEYGLKCHAGHGLNFDNVVAIAKIIEISELNIGHFLICDAVFSGLGSSVSRMSDIITEARSSLT